MDPATVDGPSASLTIGADGVQLRPGRSYLVGRDPLCDIALADPRIAWRHAVLRGGPEGWVLEHAGSPSGTYVDGVRVRRTTLAEGSRVRFADLDDGPVAEFHVAGAPPQQHGEPAPARSIALGGERVTIGRAEDNDVVVEDLMVSAHHAELRLSADGGDADGDAGPDGDTGPDGAGAVGPGAGRAGLRYEVVDLRSDNGTYLNGGSVERAAVSDGDVIGVGYAVFVLDGAELDEFDESGGVWLDVDSLVVTAPKDGQRLLDGVSFPVPERCLLGIIGPSGAGKSTLLQALTGQLSADSGRVLYDGRDLHREYAELRQRIGVVPQQDILHVHLRMRRALGYAARLRFSRDTTASERDGRIDEVTGALGLTGREELRIKTLSGGQRKRVSVALELLTKPSLLLLDEPTSGLDPGMDRAMMRVLADLAHGGRTVIVVTHSVLNLSTCDRLLVLAPGGRLAYYGRPEETLDFLGFDSWAEAFDAFADDGGRDWSGQFEASALHREFVVDGGGRDTREAVSQAGGRLTLRRWLSQVRTLMARYLAVIASDRMFLAIMLALPVVLGAMARALAGSALDTEHTVNTVLILCVGAVLTGTANSVRELVKERPVYRRERAVGLPRSAYLTSKVLVLGAISVVQSVVLTLVALAGVDVDPAGYGGVWGPVLLELLITSAALAFTAMMGGLVVSALVGREEVTMPLLVLIAIIQVIFCGALLPLHTMPGLAEISWFVPARWALGAMAGTLHLQARMPHTFGEDPLFAADAASWAMDLGILAALSIAAGGIVYWLLRRQEPAVMRRR